MAVRIEVLVYDQRVPHSVYYPFGQVNFTRFTQNIIGRDTIYLDIPDNTLRNYTIPADSEAGESHALLRDHTIGDVHGRVAELVEI